MTTPNFALDWVGADEAKPVLVVRGEIDAATEPTLRRALEQASEGEPRRVVVDLGAVTFCDSTGLNTLVAAHNRLQAGEGELVLRQTPPIVMRLLEITDLTSTFLLEA